MSKNTVCFIGAINGQVAIFCALIHFCDVGGGHWRVHRIVTLPDFQGIGLARNFLKIIGQHIPTNKKFFITTSSPTMINSLARSGFAKMIRFGRSGKHLGKIGQQLNRSSSCKRKTASFEIIQKRIAPNWIVRDPIGLRKLQCCCEKLSP